MSKYDKPEEPSSVEAVEEDQFKRELAALSEWKYAGVVKSTVLLNSKGRVRYWFTHQIGDIMFYDKYEYKYGGDHNDHYE